MSTTSVAELVKRDPGWLGSQQAPEGFVFKSPGRSFRLISIETEVDGDRSLFPRTLYHCGLVSHPEVLPYGWHPETAAQRVYPGFIKHDGSVTGGELVIELLDLTRKDHAENLQLILDRLRALEKARVIQYNPNCGGHIHVDAHGLGIYDLWRLNDSYSYIEDLVYRLAGAGKTYGHRSLFKGMERHPGGYANPVVKGPFITVHDCFGRLRKQTRMSGLNYSGYFKNGCKCGKSTRHETDAFHEACRRHGISQNSPDGKLMLQEYGTLDRKNCICKGVKNTVEWRVWNSQGNPRILYAWIALMQSLFAYSYRPSGAGYDQVDQHEALSYTGKELGKSISGFAKQAQERAEWLFTELPLEPIEKDALAYAFMRSECKSWGAPFFKRLVNTPTKRLTTVDPYFPPNWLARKIVKAADIPVPKEEPGKAPPFGGFADNGPVPEGQGFIDWLSNDAPPLGNPPRVGRSSRPPQYQEDSAVSPYAGPVPSQYSQYQEWPITSLSADVQQAVADVQQSVTRERERAVPRDSFQTALTAQMREDGRRHRNIAHQREMDRLAQRQAAAYISRVAQTPPGSPIPPPPGRLNVTDDSIGDQ